MTFAKNFDCSIMHQVVSFINKILRFSHVFEVLIFLTILITTLPFVKTQNRINDCSIDHEDFMYALKEWDDINDTIRCFEFIDYSTAKFKSINSLVEVFDYLEELFHINKSENEHLSLSKIFVNVLSILINQINNWDDLSVRQKYDMATSILLHLPNVTSSLKPYFIGTNKSIEIMTRNIFLKIHSTKCTENIIFGLNDSSIEVAHTTYFNESEECYIYLVGYLIDKINDYLWQGSDEFSQFYTKVIALTIEIKYGKIYDSGELPVRTR